MTIGTAAGGTVTLGSTAAASSARLTWEDVLTVGEGGKGTLTINAGNSVSALAGGTGQLVIGADVGSSGAVSLAGTGASLSGTALFVGGTATKQGGAGSLSISAGASATFANATIWATDKVTDAGALSVSGALSGSGSVQISGAGQFTLRGSDSQPESTSSPADRTNGSTSRPRICQASKSRDSAPMTRSTSAGSRTAIRSASVTRATSPPYASFRPARRSEVALCDEGRSGRVSFRRRRWSAHFCSNASRVRDRVERSRPGGQAAPYALPLDVFATSFGGVPYPTGAVLDPFIGDAMFAGHYGGAFLSAHAFP